MKGSDVAINPIVKSLIESIGVGSQGRVRVRYSKPVFAQIFIGGLSIIDTPFFTRGIFQTNKEERLPAELPAQHRRKALRPFCFL